MIKVKDLLKDCVMDTEFAIYLPIRDERVGSVAWDDKKGPDWISTDHSCHVVDRRTMIPKEYLERFCSFGTGLINTGHRLQANIMPLLVLYLHPLTDEEKES